MTENNLDHLMDLDPLSLTKADLDAIITYHRNRRAEAAANGGKAKRATKESGPSPALGELMKKIVGEKKQTVVVKRRI